MPFDAAPFRRAPLHCPRCRIASLSAGRLHRCETCAGSWIDEQTLAEHVGTMRDRIAERLDWRTDDERAPLACAACHEPMEALRLFEVSVDRCKKHGVWFDDRELALVLERSSASLCPPPQSSIAARAVEPAAHVAAEAATDISLAGIEAAVEVGFGATEVAAGAAEAAAGLLEGVLDVIGGIFSAIDF